MINWLINKLMFRKPDPFAGMRHIGHKLEAPKPATKHHNFVLQSRNQWTGRTSYRCRCGAWYANGWQGGWKLTEYQGPGIPRSCHKPKEF